MKPATQVVIILVTAPTLAIARKLARAALKRKLIACANLVPRIESHYWWKRSIEASTEVLLILKSRKPLLRELESVILSLHPYDTPEFVVLSLAAGSQRYLQWLHNETALPALDLSPKRDRRKRSARR